MNTYSDSKTSIDTNTLETETDELFVGGLSKKLTEGTFNFNQH